MNIVEYNSKAWDQEVETGNVWTKPVSEEIINSAKNGNWDIVMTPTKPVPKSWFPKGDNIKVLCLASGGGQQGPTLAAAGYNVTVFDNSEMQLKGDKDLSKKYNLNIKTEKGDMRDLSCFENEVFDFIIHPVSNLFVDNILPVWKEAYRVLKKGGVLISGFVNPLSYMFDYEQLEKNIFEVKYSIPYSDIKQLPKDKLDKLIENKYPVEHGHTLEDQINGQIQAGFIINGFYEDTFGGQSALDKHISTFITTKAQKI